MQATPEKPPVRAPGAYAYDAGREIASLTEKIDAAEQVTDKIEQLLKFTALGLSSESAYDREARKFSGSEPGESDDETLLLKPMAAFLGIAGGFGGLGMVVGLLAGGLVGGLAVLLVSGGLFCFAAAEPSPQPGPAPAERKFIEAALLLKDRCITKVNDLTHSISPAEIARSSHFERLMEDYPSLKERFILAAARENFPQDAPAGAAKRPLRLKL